MRHARKLVAELVGDLEHYRVEIDLDARRVIVWRQRIDREEPERHEISMAAE